MLGIGARTCTRSFPSYARKKMKQVYVERGVEELCSRARAWHERGKLAELVGSTDPFAVCLLPRGVE